jgi:hypothetical protein
LGKYKITEISVDFGDFICIYAKGKKIIENSKNIEIYLNPCVLLKPLRGWLQSSVKHISTAFNMLLKLK